MVTSMILSGLTAAIAKGLVKIAFANTEPATTVAFGLVDTVRGAFDSNHQAAAVDLEAEARRIAVAAVSAMERDHGGLAENEAAAGVLAARSAIEQADVDARLLVKLDLDPGRLSAHILSRDADSRRLDVWPEGVAGEVARRVVVEVSRRFVIVGTRLPTFAFELDSSQLRRLQILQSSVEEALSWSRMKSSSAPVANAQRVSVSSKSAIGQLSRRRSISLCCSVWICSTKAASGSLCQLPTPHCGPRDHVHFRARRSQAVARASSPCSDGRTAC
jgi:hypothetical protein